jgi:uncharacterized protein
MEIVLIIASFLVVLGILGSSVPAMPGPILSFLGIAILFFAKPDSVSSMAFLLFGLGVVFLFVLDYVGPILGAKFSGASRNGVWGVVIGGILGLLFFPPLGIFLGAFLGAFLTETWSGKKYPEAFLAALGVIVGSLVVLAFQVVFSLIAAVYFFAKLFFA